MRTASSSGLSALRIIEDEAARGRGDRILLRAGREAAIYVLNKKRGELAEIEERYGVTVEVMIDEAFEGARMSVESSGARPDPKDRAIAAPIIDDDEDLGDEAETDDDDIEEDGEVEEAGEERPARREGGRDGPREARAESDEDGARRKRRRRRGGRGRNRRDGERDDGEREAGEAGEAGESGEQDLSAIVADDEQAPVETEERQSEQGEDGEERQRSRRGRRGGRSRRGRSDAASVADGEVDADSAPLVEAAVADQAALAAVEAAAEVEPIADDKSVPSNVEGPKTRRRPRARKADAEPAVEVAAVMPLAPTEAAGVADDVPAAPKRRSRAKKAVAPIEPDGAIQLAVADASAGELPIAASNDQAATGDNGDGEAGDDAEARRGWWQRTFG